MHAPVAHEVQSWLDTAVVALEANGRSAAQVGGQPQVEPEADADRVPHRLGHPVGEHHRLSTTGHAGEAARGIGEASMRGLRYVASMTPFLYMGSYSEYLP